MKADWQDIEQWPAIAKEVGYRVGEFADKLEISPRWLDEFCRKTFQKSPHQLLAQFRSAVITRQAKGEKTGKEILSEVKRRHCSTLTRASSRDRSLS